MDIEFSVNDFQGPLDLLLHLIKTKKMDIMDIEIDIITKEYMEVINNSYKLNLEVTSQYLLIASELLEIKSKILLHEPNEEEEVDDPREELVQKLLEYSAYKEISNILQDKSYKRSEIYTKIPEKRSNYLEEETREQIGTMDDLVCAMKNFLNSQLDKKPVMTKINKTGISIKQRRLEIKSLLKKNVKTSFIDLFEEASYEYVVATFIAILEMAKEKELQITQQNEFSMIYCEAV